MASLPLPVAVLSFRYEKIKGLPSRFQPVVCRRIVRSTRSSVSLKVGIKVSSRWLGTLVQEWLRRGRRLLSLGIEEFFRRTVVVADGLHDEGSGPLGFAVGHPVELGLDGLDIVLAKQLHHPGLAHPEKVQAGSGLDESVIRHRRELSRNSSSFSEASSSEWKNAQSGSPSFLTPM